MFYKYGILLKPCPVCGRKPELIIKYDSSYKNNKRCYVYYCPGYYVMHYKGQPQESIRKARVKWNETINDAEGYFIRRINEINKSTINKLFKE